MKYPLEKGRGGTRVREADVNMWKLVISTSELLSRRSAGKIRPPERLQSRSQFPPTKLGTHLVWMPVTFSILPALTLDFYFLSLAHELQPMLFLLLMENYWEPVLLFQGHGLYMILVCLQFKASSRYNKQTKTQKVCVTKCFQIIVSDFKKEHGTRKCINLTSLFQFFFLFFFLNFSYITYVQIKIFPSKK